MCAKYTSTRAKVTLAHVANPVAARLSVNLGTDALEDGLDAGPGSRGAARHEGGAVPRTVLPSTHSTPDKQETLLCQSLAATLEANQTEHGSSLREGRKKIHTHVHTSKV